MTFAHPIVLVLPLLYVVVRLLGRGRRSSAEFSSSALLDALPPSARLRLREPVLVLLTTLAAVSAGIAAARPQQVSLIEQRLDGRNIMLVIDATRSMAAQDFPTSFGYGSRMEGVKTVVAEYVRNRTRDRIGLVVFGNTSYLQSPLTTDTSLVEELVQALRPGMAGDGTAIGNGLGLALKRLKDIEGSSKAVILVTDGVNNAGQVSPLKAAQVAKDLGIQIHTIGVGSGKASLGDPLLGGLMGLQGGPSADFDEEMLTKIAQLTGGVYFNARSMDGFQDVYRELERLAKTDDEQPAKTVIEELFAPFALSSLALYALALILGSTLFLKVP